jgi:hypothetical protein
MEDKELIQKIMQKKEFSQLPLKDVELAFEKFAKKNLNEYQKVKLTRNFLRRIFSSFSSRKVFSKKDEDAEWYMKKHKSTNERLPYYKEIYERVFKNLDKKTSVIDLGCGVNGFSYGLMEEAGNNIEYTGVEAIGQFVELMNSYFKTEKIKGKTFHLSLFELEKIKKIIGETKKPRVVLMFKVVDSLELVERNYSKEFLNEIAPLSDRIVVSFATRSLGSRKKFSVQRGWLTRFISENFNIIDDFEVNGERYIVFENKV